MQKFDTITSEVVPLLLDHVDTDQIIPARFLKTTVKDGIGENLFRDWKWTKDNEPIESFILNQEREDGKFLLAGDNFGCGSSREHAVWALVDYGFRAVFANSFADIFKQNALNNGLLPIEVPKEIWNELKTASEKPKKEITISLPEQTVYLPSGNTFFFPIDEFRKECIINGFSDLDYLVSRKEEISQFEQKHIVPPIF